MDGWIPAAQAEPDGTPCAIRVRDGLGSYELLAAHFFHDDGKWYRVEPPTLIALPVTHFKPI